MDVVKNINNNVILCKDNSGNELVAFGKGIGFGKVPRSIELNKIERTFYNLNSHYINLINELPEEIFTVSIKTVEKAKTILKIGISNNMVFSLADHISFALERIEKGIKVKMPFEYDVENLYPKEMEIGKIALAYIYKIMKIKLPKSEQVGIALHFLNTLYTAEEVQKSKDVEQIILNITNIIEEAIHIKINKSNFNYYRFCCHCRYFIKRIGEKKQYYQSEDDEMYRYITEKYPLVYQCAYAIQDYLLKEFGAECTREELLYLMIHIHRLYTNEGSDR